MASLVIVSLVLWLIFFIIFSDAIRSFSPFSKLTAFSIGFILTFILAAIGFIRKTAFFLLYGIPGFLGDWSAGALFFWTIVILLIGVIWSKVSKHLRELRALREAEKKGIEYGGDNLFVRAIKKVFTK